ELAALTSESGESRRYDRMLCIRQRRGAPRGGPTIESTWIENPRFMDDKWPLSDHFPVVSSVTLSESEVDEKEIVNGNGNGNHVEIDFDLKKIAKEFDEEGSVVVSKKALEIVESICHGIFDAADKDRDFRVFLIGSSGLGIPSDDHDILVVSNRTRDWFN